MVLSGHGLYIACATQQCSILVVTVFLMQTEMQQIPSCILLRIPFLLAHAVTSNFTNEIGYSNESNQLQPHDSTRAISAPETVCHGACMLLSLHAG